MTTRILVADDYEPWRRFVASLVLFGQPQWRIVGEASDGAEIVRKAKELQPDLVLLDIRMPEINGFEAARQIVKIVPGAKILFLSGFDSPEMVEEAMRTGAHGYVVKLDAVRELVCAVESVFRGERFVSKRFKGCIAV
jgi:DNA-binding NarL/FixJ family response regulator